MGIAVPVSFWEDLLVVQEEASQAYVSVLLRNVGHLPTEMLTVLGEEMSNLVDNVAADALADVIAGEEHKKMLTESLLELAALLSGPNSTKDTLPERSEITSAMESFCRKLLASSELRQRIEPLFFDRVHQMDVQVRANRDVSDLPLAADSNLPQVIDKEDVDHQRQDVDVDANANVDVDVNDRANEKQEAANAEIAEIMFGDPGAATGEGCK